MTPKVSILHIHYNNPENGVLGNYDPIQSELAENEGKTFRTVRSFKAEIHRNRKEQEIFQSSARF
jgi:hypothetical protein